MLNQTATRNGMSAPVRASRRRSALLISMLGVMVTAAAAPSAAETTRWDGRLVALDEASGTMTVSAQAADPAALAALADAQAGDRIRITLSADEDRAGEILHAAPYDGASAPEAASDAAAGDAAAEEKADAHFLLSAALVAVDADGAGLTFETPMPGDSLGTLRALTPGAGITATVAGGPDGADAALLAIAAANPSPEWRPAPPLGASYRWQGEAVSLDEASGMLTVTSRVVTPGGLAALAGAAPDDPIVITWSGFDSRASGIRAAMPDDGSGLWGSNRFLLQAAFVEADEAGRYLTFRTPVPAGSLSTVRSLTRGAWAVAMSPHHPADGAPAVLSVDAYAPLPERGPALLPGASYRWQGELVSLDEPSEMLTVTSRVATPDGLAAVAGAAPGDPVVITWSGFESRTSGIRAVTPDDGSGLWGSDRFLLRATFVEADETGRYLTFAAPVPAGSLSTVRSLTRGSWARMLSPHHPADAAPVLSVDAYAPQRDQRPAPLPGATYRWDGELVSLDGATDMLTVKARVAAPTGLTALAGAEAGAPIVITWSGYESRANGIRAAMPDDGSGLWGSDRFLLRATFVEAAEAGRYLTFRTKVPAGSLSAARSLTRGAWASVTSLHHPAGGAGSVLAVNAYLPSPPERRPTPLPGAGYRWDGELVSLDESSGALTVKSRVASPAGLAGLADTQAGAPIVITWSGYDSRANGIRAAMPDDDSGLWGSDRFLLRATFVAAAEAGRYLTFEVAVPDGSLEAIRALDAGAWTSVMSPHHPADAAPAVMAVAAYAASATLESAAQ